MTDRLDDLLRGLPLLRAVPAADLGELQATRVVRERGGVFFDQGGPADAVYGVITGRVRLVKRAPSGRELCLDLLGPGEPVAAVPVLKRCALPATAIAAELAACVCVSAERFRWLVQRHPWLAQRVFEVVAQRLMDAAEARLSLATDPVETRLAQVMLKLSERYAEQVDGRLVFGASLTRQLLADMAGTTVESAIRALSRWTQAGVIRSTNSRITVLAPGALQQLASRVAGAPSDPRSSS